MKIENQILTFYWKEKQSTLNFRNIGEEKLEVRFEPSSNAVKVI